VFEKFRFVADFFRNFPLRIPVDGVAMAWALLARFGAACLGVDIASPRSEAKPRRRHWYTLSLLGYIIPDCCPNDTYNIATQYSATKSYTIEMERI
jgi:hypothetical protein